MFLTLNLVTILHLLKDICKFTRFLIDFLIYICYSVSMIKKELNPTTSQTDSTNLTGLTTSETYQMLKHKPFRFGDYYYLQEPTPALKQLLNNPTGSLPELLSHIFNRTHQSRYTVFPTLYKQLTDLLNYTDNETNQSSTYNINLLFRESKLAGFQYSQDLSSTPNGFYFMNYYNARITIKPITNVYAIRREHLVAIIDLLEEYNRSGFVIRTSHTKQPIKAI